MGILSVLFKAVGGVMRALTPGFLLGKGQVEAEDRSSGSENGRREESNLNSPVAQNFPQNTESITLFTGNPELNDRSYQFSSPPPRYSGSFAKNSPAQVRQIQFPADSGEDGFQEAESSAFGQRTNQRSPRKEEINLERENPKRSNSFSKKFCKPDPFDGKSRELHEYIGHFKSVSDWNGWSYEEEGMQLAMCLKGLAKQAVLDMGNPKDFSEQVDILTERFSPKDDIETSQCEFRNRKRKRGETVQEYGFALRELFNKAYGTASDFNHRTKEMFILEQFIVGLGSNELQDHVQLEHPRTLSQAMAIAREFEMVKGRQFDRVRKPLDEGREYRVPVRRVDEERDNKKKSSTNSKRDNYEKSENESDLRENIQELQKMVHALVEKDRKREENLQQVRGACFICGDRNHFARQCPKKGSNVFHRNHQNGQHYATQNQRFTPVNNGPLNH